MSKLKFSDELGKKTADTIRLLAADGVQKANSGHPGMPMGMADVAAVLFTHFLRFNPEDPQWPNRDRFVLSAGHGSMLIYSMLYLCGYPVTVEDLSNFRQYGSKTAGHPEFGEIPGIETTTGPLGQGFGNGIGMAIAAKMTAERFNTADQNIFGNETIYAIVSDGELMEGVSHEAASIAGHLGLGNIVYIYDDNKITIEGSTDLTFAEDVQKRFEAYGWQVLHADGHDQLSVFEALQAGKNETEKPTIIITKSHIGYGSPNKQDTHGVHGAPLGEDELRETKKHFGWPEDAEFFVPAEVQTLFNETVELRKSEYQTWQNELDAWKKKNPELAKLWDIMQNKTVPENIGKQLLSELPSEATATRSLGGKVMQKIAELVPSLVGGSADLAPSTNTMLKAYDSIAPGKFAGRNFHFGIREHGMGAIINGISLYGGFIPFGATFLVFSDYMRPTIRLAAIMGIQVIYVFTHDSIFVGEDGPTHQPVEHFAALRAIPNLTVLRPADGFEVAGSWEFALNNRKQPTALLLTRQKLAWFDRGAEADPSIVAKGGYVFKKGEKENPDVVLVATGSELEVAVEAQKLLAGNGVSANVVSMPSIELYKKQSKSYRDSVIPEKNTKVVVVEAGIPQGWGRITDLPLLVLGIERFGASGPYKVLAEKFGFTGKQVAEKVRNWLNS